MTERTEALALQAAEYAIELTVNNPELYIPTLMEKFAELIILECARVATQTPCPCVESARDIRKHFGVE